MRSQIDIFVAGPPKAQPRVKAFSRGGRAGVYTPSTADGWRNLVKLGFSEFEGLGLTGAIEVEVAFFFDRPKSHRRTGKYSDLLKDSAPTHHLVKPDPDNLVKLPLDVATKLKIFSDDSQVVKMLVTKEFSDNCEAGMRFALKEVKI